MHEDQRRELLLLAEGLLRVPQDQFDMGVWGQGDVSESAFGNFECGFAGCAMGWAPHLIPNCGLRLVRTQYCSLVPSFNGFLGYSAVANYFGISVDKAEYLFSAMSYGKCSGVPEITRERVASRIRSCLSEEWTRS